METFAKTKELMQWMWSLGDYARLALLLEPYAEALADACDIRAGMQVLDVGAGNGNFAMAAARRGALVTASDITPRMVELGRARSAAADLTIAWVEGDAEQLPFPDASFDIVASVFGAMFAPQPDRVASELLRVVKPHGLIAMANYSPAGFLGRLMEAMSSSVPAPSVDLPSPFLWGDPDEARRRLAGAASIDVRNRKLTFEFASFDDWLALWEASNGPQIALKSTLPTLAYRQVVNEMRLVLQELNRSNDGRLVLESDYIQLLARPKAQVQ
jgi:SAM-dependent methyltransferase